MQPIAQYSPTRVYRAGTLTSYSLAVERVIAAMRSHVADALSLAEMAEIAYLSPFHFNRVFRSFTGTPPGEFLAALRLDAAKRLLLTTSLSVTDVCFDLGYASLGTFTQRFKTHTGLSPLQLRQLAGDVAGGPLQTLLVAHSEARRLAVVREDGVRGTITAPSSFSGLIFLGLFSRPIAQEQPAACTTLTVPGPFQLGPVPDGRYFLLGAALPWSENALSYLLPDADLLVGFGERPVLVRGGRAHAPAHLTLRPVDVTDPPLLGVFPPLRAAPAAMRVRAAL